MHPALSVIFFTTVSGFGYGLLFLTGLALASDPVAIGARLELLALVVGGAFAAAGLTSSMLHLGQPQRAWRAFSQWRSSWLSREGVAALLSFVPMLVLAVLLWRIVAEPAFRPPAPGILLTLRIGGVALALVSSVTVFCTARIYTSLKTIPAWHNAYVLPGYLQFALLGGAGWLWALAALTGADDWLSRESLPVLVAALAALGAVLKRSYWAFIDTAPAASTAESATGLGRFGSVRGSEAPHTEENYLTREMGFALARKHAARLRVIALVLFAVSPVALAVPALVLRSPLLVTLYAVVAALAATAGTFVERWLFFAEAKHVVMLYYAGAPRPAD
jgi:DMSO reductase anchor subunit